MLDKNLRMGRLFMIGIYKKFIILFIAVNFLSVNAACSDESASLVGVTSDVTAYAQNTVKPVLDSYEKKDLVSVFLKINDVLLDPDTGIRKNTVYPSVYMDFDRMERFKLGFFVISKLSAEQQAIVRMWREKFMRNDPAGVFFAPSAGEIVRTKAAFGCSHYARSFIAVVKALGLAVNPSDLRYAVSCKEDDYKRALAAHDNKQTINGHQFVLARIGSGWIAINTSKSEWTAMPDDFTPDVVEPGRDIPIRFKSYPDVVFLLRKVGTDYNDDCGDGSLSALMNIYRSGSPRDVKFMWPEFKTRSNSSG